MMRMYKVNLGIFQSGSISKEELQMTTKISRRELLKELLQKTGQITMASGVIYSISLIQGKGPFGQLAAGAKCCPGRWVIDGNRCAPFVYPSPSQCELGSIVTGRSGCSTDWIWRCDN